MNVREANSEDNLGMRKVQVSTWRHTYRGMIPDHILDQMTDENPPLRTKTPDPVIVKSRRAYVAVDGSNQVIGFAVGGLPRTAEGNYASELWAIYVLPSEQGQGIGKELFNRLVSNLSVEYKSLIIWSLEANLSSHKFYESMGGKRLCFTKSFKIEDEHIATEIAYGWDQI